jgi:hypothetical protein
MSTQLEPQTSSVPAKRDFPKIDRFFDTAEHIAERSETLLSKVKPALISLFLLVHLVIDLAIVIAYVLTK